MRWGNQDKIERIERQNDSLLSMQLVELAEAKAIHTHKNQFMETRRNRAGKGLKKLSGFLYVIMMVVAIPLGYFVTLIDLEDGVFDGHFKDRSSNSSPDKWWKIRARKNGVGYPTTSNSGTEEEKLRMEIETLKRELANCSQPSDFAEKKPNENSNSKIHNFIYSETKWSDFKHRNNKGMKYATGAKKKALKAYQKLIQEGSIPSVNRIAEKAGVSWATANRTVEEFALEVK